MPDGPRGHSLKVPGLSCPECSTPIVIDPLLLLSATPINCASCGLELVVNTEESAETLQALESYLAEFYSITETLATRMEGATGSTGGERCRRRGTRARPRRGEE